MHVYSQYSTTLIDLGIDRCVAYLNYLIRVLDEVWNIIEGTIKSPLCWLLFGGYNSFHHIHRPQPCRGGGSIELEAIRAAIIAELDANNLYEQLAANATDPLVKKEFLDVAKEEKTHAGEFTTQLLYLDEQQTEEMENGRKEVEELAEEK